MNRNTFSGSGNRVGRRFDAGVGNIPFVGMKSYNRTGMVGSIIPIRFGEGVHLIVEVRPNVQCKASLSLMPSHVVIVTLNWELLSEVEDSPKEVTMRTAFSREKVLLESCASRALAIAADSNGAVSNTVSVAKFLNNSECAVEPSQFASVWCLIGGGTRCLVAATKLIPGGEMIKSKTSRTVCFLVRAVRHSNGFACL